MVSEIIINTVLVHDFYLRLQVGALNDHIPPAKQNLNIPPIRLYPWLQL